MHNRLAAFFLVAAAGTAMAISVRAQDTSPELGLVARAATALGGRERVMALKTLQIVGYGELAYMNGGGNISADPAAPQKWQKVLEYTRTIDLEHGRTRVQQRVKMDFVFASTAGQLGLNRTNETLDGDVAYNIGGGALAAASTGTPQPQRAGNAAARQRRVELLAHPITIVRAALDPSSKLSNLRKQANLQLVDVTIRQGDTLTLAVSAASNLPAWVSYVGPNGNLGDVTYRTAFVGYEPEKGVQLPTGIATTIDWRNVVQSKLYVDRNIVDGPIDDLSAPASVRAAGPSAGRARRRREPAADQGCRSRVVPERQRVLRIRRPHHDGRGEPSGCGAAADPQGRQLPRPRQARDAGDPDAPSLRSQRRTPGRRGRGTDHHLAPRERRNLPRDGGSSRHAVPRRSGRNPRPLKFIPVDDHLKQKDATNEIDIYHIVGNYHMADGVIIHVPASNVLVEADLTTQDWDFNWWGDSLMNNIEHRKIMVTTNLSVHAQKPFPLPDVVSAIERQVRNTQAFCQRAAAAQLFQPGCPIQYNRPLAPLAN